MKPIFPDSILIKLTFSVILAGGLLAGCGTPRAGAVPDAKVSLVPEVSGRVNELQQEIQVLQEQVTRQDNLSDLSANQLKDRAAQYGKQSDLLKGFIFFLAGLCVVMFLAPAPEGKWTGLLMIGALVATFATLGVWVFRI